MDPFTREQTEFFHVYGPIRAVAKIAKKDGLTNAEAWSIVQKIQHVYENEIEPIRENVCSHTHYTGECYELLDDEERWAIYCLADGFGRRASAELRKINGGWDWSHIRDSSYDGWRRMAIKLDEILAKKGF